MAVETAPVLVDRATRQKSLMQTVVTIVAYRELVRNLVVKDLKLKYRGSVIGFLWSLVNPLAMIGIYTLAFKYILGMRQPGFPFFILLGLLAWSFFSNCAVMSTHTIVEGGSLVKAVRFPKAILPLATVIFNLVQYLLTIVALLPLMFVVYRMPAAGPILLYPVFLLLQVMLIVGVSLMLAAATAFFRDVRHFVDIALALLFWTTPIVYPLTQASAQIQALLMLSPMTPFVVAYQRIFYYGVVPELRVWAGALVYGVGVFLIGALWFVSIEDRIGDEIS
jgi:lipopolysaccharide transport system permease protein